MTSKCGDSKTSRFFQFLFVKKIEASKVLIGLKSKKVTQQNSETNQPKAIVSEAIKIEHHDPEKNIFKLPEGVDNIDSEW